ncbi:UDP-N-acetylmuramoyl-tripeptide--D-alanyl-D-alanine ligase [Chlamydia sp.]|uniref:UDP-N-acetylmuramoyl-tripeptide--D-alanyl-D- alanine ligase n=1 Tax=Chlamydia sp. TaxID=35827 RepID=UPI0025C00DDD|nr:UDP-N-acetylmuramoyl-tripeptide--D-alanyl-D-alanine ligase [Chlamydia sp.]MBQ8498597.1 UDP-N-acetylmuramoyl-tripeptide--D-alanyl-D-alanine ligase [Chlamydia sp.]
MRPILLEEWASLLLDIKVPHSGKKVTGVAIDSRLVLPGDVFFALPGGRTNGHMFLKQAAQSGAVAAVVANDYHGPDHGLQLLRVADPRESLREAGRIQGALFQGEVIGITGSLGKTTTKSFTSQLLSSSYKVFASPKSYNSQLTLPLSILMADGDEDFLLLEMGVSEPNNMKSLLEVIEPTIGVITHIDVQHAMNFLDTGAKGIVEEKSLLLERCGVQLMPKDSSWFSFFAKRNPAAEQFSFSMKNETADFYYRAIHSEGVLISAPDGDIELPVVFPYSPAYMNFIIAVALAWITNVPMDRLEQVSPSLFLPSMRFEQKERNGIRVINDAYNASPDAMFAALDAVPMPSDGGRIIFILGHMAELGRYSDECHIAVARKAVEKAHVVFFVGEKWLPVKEVVQDTDCLTGFYSSASEIIDVVKPLVHQGDVILLKGSRSLELETLLPCFSIS